MSTIEASDRALDLTPDWNDVAEKSGVQAHIKHDHFLDSAIWNPATNVYDMAFKTGTEELKISHHILVSCVGGFSEPLIPKVPGLNTFKGTVVHTATWPEDMTTDSLKGKEVLIVGNGCSG